MQIRNDVLILSASDLTRAAECEFAVLRRLDAKLGRIEPLDSAEEALLKRTAELGLKHEDQVLQDYVAQFGTWDGSGGGVATVDQPAGEHQDSTAGLMEAASVTRELLSADPDVIFQACFFDGTFLGYADFIRREGQTWVVQDTKLARRAKVQALIQLGAYADQLLALGFTPAARVELILGTKAISAHRTDELVAVYRARMARLRGLLEAHRGGTDPVAWGASGITACLRCEVCTPFIEDGEDVLLVAGLTVQQRDRLIAAGIRTVADLAASTEPVDGIGLVSLERLRRQAVIQHRQTTGDGSVVAELADPSAIEALPPASPGDIFFDFEGDPLWFDETAADRDDAWGLEYLFGIVEAPIGDAAPEFRPFWAHDRTQEKAALIAFLEYVTQRREAHPDLHIYHYAPYERSALLMLAARYGFGEALIDQWLREGLLVDLYATVRNSIRVGQPSYSLKKLEPLFREAREDEVTSAGDSIVAYAEACAAREAGDIAGWEQRLADIADYNETDCVATWQLRNWLLGWIEPTPTEAVEIDQTRPPGDIDPLAQELMAHAGDPPRSDDAQAVAMLAAAVGYHWREAKPYWWAHFDRLMSDPSEWMDRRGSLVADQVTVVEDWHLPTPRTRNWRRVLRLIGRLEPGSDLKAGAGAVVIYDPVVPENASTSETGHRGWVGGAEVVSTGMAADGEHDMVIVRESGPSKKVVGHTQLPMGIGPGPGPGTKTLVEAITKVGEAVLSSLPGPLPQGPALDLLQRLPPRTSTGASLPAPTSDRPLYETITDALLTVDNSYLAVQGPPGTGKTYNGARVVARLVSLGWKVGVVGQSHAVVEHFLRGAQDAGVPQDLIAKGVGTGRTQSDLPWPDITPAWLASREGGLLTGGTAWTYVADTKIPEGGYDLIVVDEAGQFALANTIAVAGAAPRMLLLGDPQQLPQVSQGSHPEPVDTSALGWLSAGHDTLPPEYGYFLDQTWRMHPALCAQVSRMSYENRLTAHPATARRSLSGVDPGVTGVPVAHHGNSVVAPEEVDEVLAQLADLIGRDWTDGDTTRQLTPAEVLIVAPYNAQVWAIRQALDESPFAAARVGTVDKFQGQEAPVVLVSLAASSAEAAPRGMDFLLNRNRLNVAISRAQWCARVIHSPAIADYLPRRPEQLGELGAFLQIVTPGSRA